ncbi:hypothetical protein B2J93_7116 [Marssonina coronariae]|uniref:Uncharacterized protein n=1 Tax=Diplocarpon coronariae TaxID=2795749 RepID=A0A218YWB8_9HELO|nr:hypothetical protein B2J93_7116 [Marssonina coronariae]
MAKSKSSATTFSKKGRSKLKRSNTNQKRSNDTSAKPSVPELPAKSSSAIPAVADQPLPLRIPEAHDFASRSLQSESVKTEELSSSAVPEAQIYNSSEPSYAKDSAFEDASSVPQPNESHDTELLKKDALMPVRTVQPNATVQDPVTRSDIIEASAAILETSLHSVAAKESISPAISTTLTRECADATKISTGSSGGTSQSQSPAGPQNPKPLKPLAPCVMAKCPDFPPMPRIPEDMKILYEYAKKRDKIQWELFQRQNIRYQELDDFVKAKIASQSKDLTELREMAECRLRIIKAQDNLIESQKLRLELLESLTAPEESPLADRHIVTKRKSFPDSDVVESIRKRRCHQPCSSVSTIPRYGPDIKNPLPQKNLLSEAATNLRLRNPSLAKFLAFAGASGLHGSTDSLESKQVKNFQEYMDHYESAEAINTQGPIENLEPTGDINTEIDTTPLTSTADSAEATVADPSISGTVRSLDPSGLASLPANHGESSQEIGKSGLGKVDSSIKNTPDSANPLKRPKKLSKKGKPRAETAKAQSGGESSARGQSHAGDGVEGPESQEEGTEKYRRGPTPPAPKSDAEEAESVQTSLTTRKKGQLVEDWGEHRGYQSHLRVLKSPIRWSAQVSLSRVTIKTESAEILRSDTQSEYESQARKTARTGSEEQAAEPDTTTGTPNSQIFEAGARSTVRRSVVRSDDAILKSKGKFVLALEQAWGFEEDVSVERSHIRPLRFAAPRYYIAGCRTIVVSLVLLVLFISTLFPAPTHPDPARNTTSLRSSSLPVRVLTMRPERSKSDSLSSELLKALATAGLPTPTIDVEEISSTKSPQTDFQVGLIWTVVKLANIGKIARNYGACRQDPSHTVSKHHPTAPEPNCIVPSPPGLDRCLEWARYWNISSRFETCVEEVNNTAIEHNLKLSLPGHNLPDLPSPPHSSVSTISQRRRDGDWDNAKGNDICATNHTLHRNSTRSAGTSSKASVRNTPVPNLSSSALGGWNKGIRFVADAAGDLALESLGAVAWLDATAWMEAQLGVGRL